MRSFLRRLGFFAVMGAAGAAVLLVSFLLAFVTGSPAVAGLTSCLLGTALVIKGTIKEEAWGGREDDGVVVGIISVIAAGLAAFVGSVPLVEVRRLSFGEQREVFLEELVEHRGVARFRVRDGQVAAHAVRTKHHRHSDSHPPTSYEHAVAPVLPPGWQPGDPIWVWAVCHDFSSSRQEAECLQAWHEPAGGVIAADPELEPCYQLAVPPELAPREGRPMFVKWVKSPETYIAENWRDLFGLLRAIALGWCVVAGLWLVGSSVASWRRAGRAG